ncbi:MerR family transcriptional regulator [Brevibacillus centrosporus]|uniref:MerR family transcriptional regulator n=1 Tax=Brevibacillus centrosporus TaxID=54910 RepID=UPI0037FD3429
MNSPGRFTIRQVAERTKLSTQVIRKWEERYELIKPQRLSNGYRVYTQQDVETILRVKALVDQNYSLQTAVMNVKQQSDFSEDTIVPLEKERLKSHFVEKLIKAGSNCEEAALLRLLQRAHFEYPIDAFIQKVVLPFLKQVGDLWESGGWSEYQEHISSQVVRDYISHLRKGIAQDPEMPLILGTCLPYEMHEIPVHIMLLQAAQKGWRSMFLCPSPAVGAIEKAVERLQPMKVILSAMTVQPFSKDDQLLGRLDHFAVQHPHIQFFLGGSGAIQYTEGKKLRAIIVTEDLNEVLQIPR